MDMHGDEGTNKLEVIVWLMWLGQIILALTAILATFEVNGLDGAYLFASILSYFAFVGIGLSLANSIIDSSRDMLFRVISFIYYVALLVTLYFAAVDPASVLNLFFGGAI